jgi:hypothetical protein
VTVRPHIPGALQLDISRELAEQRHRLVRAAIGSTLHGRSDAEWAGLDAAEVLPVADASKLPHSSAVAYLLHDRIHYAVVFHGEVRPAVDHQLWDSMRWRHRKGIGTRMLATMADALDALEEEAHCAKTLAPKLGDKGRSEGTARRLLARLASLGAIREAEPTEGEPKTRARMWRLA